MTGDLVERLRNKIAEIEQVAIAASSDRDGRTPTGEHWRWECTTCDQPVPITPVTVLDEHMLCPSCEYSPVALCSVEDYPTSSVGPLSHFVVRGTDEMRPVDALHLQTHDPAHVLRTIRAHRAILDDYENSVQLVALAPKSDEEWAGGINTAMIKTLGHLASIYFPESDG